MTLSQAARKYLGQQEQKGNVFKDDTELGKKLHAAGQKDGEAWCSYLGEVCAKESKPEDFDEYDKLFSANAVKTYENFRDAGYTISVLPVPDSIVVFAYYKDGKPYRVNGWTRGHLAVCECSDDDGRAYETIEGNSNSQGGREGIEVATQKRRLDYAVNNGLRLLGFIKI